MTDKELLELSAKAAGLYVLSYIDSELFGRGINTGETDSGLWNPLDDDGDALRLAVKLSINFSIDAYPNSVWRQTEVCVGHKCEHKSEAKWLEHSIEEPWGDSPYVATRRAIVLAAAEIGKAMP